MARWQDYERLACDHLDRAVGDATLTGGGADSGVDVRSPGYVAQVKAQVRPVGRPDLQRLVGASDGLAAVFYSLGGYSREALAYADETGMALFELTVDGEVIAVNGIGRTLGPTSSEGQEVLDQYEQMRARSDDGGRGRHCSVCGRVGPSLSGGIQRRWFNKVAAGPFDAYWLTVCDDPACSEAAEQVVGAVEQVEDLREQRDPRLRASREQERLIHHAAQTIDDLGMAFDFDDDRLGKPGVPTVTVLDVFEEAGLPVELLQGGPPTAEHAKRFPTLVRILEDVRDNHEQEEAARLASDPIDRTMLVAAERANALWTCGHPNCTRRVRRHDRRTYEYEAEVGGCRLTVCKDVWHREWAERAIAHAGEIAYQGHSPLELAKEANRAGLCGRPDCGEPSQDTGTSLVDACGRPGCRAYRAWLLMPDLTDLPTPDSTFSTGEERRRLSLDMLDSALMANFAGRCPAKGCKRLLSEGSPREQRYGVSLWHCPESSCQRAAERILQFLPGTS